MTARRRWLLYAVIAAGVAPMAALAALCYLLAVDDVRDDLSDASELVAGRAQAILASSDTTMRTLRAELEPSCSPATIHTLQEAVYRSLFIRGAKLIYDGAVRCSELGMISPAIAITDADLLKVPSKGMHIALPSTDDRDQTSIDLLYALNPEVTVALVINPLIFGEPVREMFARKQVSSVLVRDDGRVLSSFGADLQQEDPKLTARRTLDGYPVHITTWGTTQNVRRTWLHNCLAFMPAGLLMSLIGAASVLWMTRRRLRIDQHLRDALEANEFRVYYQPIHSAVDGRCVGAEALIRWQHPRRGLLMPGSFIPLAEETGFIVPMTYWILREVRRQLGPLLKIRPDLHIGINLTATHFSDPKLLQEIRAIFGDPFPENTLVFEVTERQALADTDGVVTSTMRELRKSGAVLLVDDFGTGHSGLQQLAEFEFDGLKIDKSFVDAIGTESVTSKLVTEIISMAKRLDMMIIAEGVERPEQADFLREHGVDYLQGWMFSKALSAHEFSAYLQKPPTPFATKSAT